MEKKSKKKEKKEKKKRKHNVSRMRCFVLKIPHNKLFDLSIVDRYFSILN